MHVPYSMDDSEPDLYGSFGSCTDTADDIDDRYWANKNVRMEKVECVKFFTQEDINKLKSELNEAFGLLSYIYNHAENLPSGVSQQIREQITKDRQ